MQKDILLYLNTLMHRWESQFDQQPSMENLSFSIGEDDMIMIAGHTVCQATLLLKEQYEIHPEYIELFLTNGDYITLEILWQYDRAPVVSAICLHHFMYQMTE